MSSALKARISAEMLQGTQLHDDYSTEMAVDGVLRQAMELLDSERGQISSEQVRLERRQEEQSDDCSSRTFRSFRIFLRTCFARPITNNLLFVASLVTGSFR